MYIKHFSFLYVLVEYHTLVNYDTNTITHLCTYYFNIADEKLRSTDLKTNLQKKNKLKDRLIFVKPRH